jgi:hypothetical protein
MILAIPDCFSNSCCNIGLVSACYDNLLVCLSRRRMVVPGRGHRNRGQEGSGAHIVDIQRTDRISVLIHSAGQYDVFVSAIRTYQDVRRVFRTSRVHIRSRREQPRLYIVDIGRSLRRIACSAKAARDQDVNRIDHRCRMTIPRGRHRAVCLRHLSCVGIPDIRCRKWLRIDAGSSRQQHTCLWRRGNNMDQRRRN